MKQFGHRNLDMHIQATRDQRLEIPPKDVHVDI